MEDFYKLVRKDEYDAEQQKQSARVQSLRETTEAFQKKYQQRKELSDKASIDIDIAKKVICECVSDLYVKSLIIDNPQDYEKSLREQCEIQVMDNLKDVKTLTELYTMFENASTYLKQALVLCEDIADSKDIKEFSKEQILNPDDLDLINKFEKNIGVDAFADEIQDRVVDVYKQEREIGEEHKEKVQNIITELSKLDKSDSITESALNCGLNCVSNAPKSVFNAIFTNRSRLALNESGAGADMEQVKEEIVASTICTYTLLETIHALGLKTFSREDKERLKYEFFVN
jgi:hypothetical protein